jgi:hypothetical protein
MNIPFTPRMRKIADDWEGSELNMHFKMILAFRGLHSALKMM